MTTILADANKGVMAADSRCLTGDYASRVQKLVRRGGMVIGTCGLVVDGDAFVEWLCSVDPKKKKPKLDGGFAALVLNDDGLWMYDACGDKVRIADGIMGIGSGGKPAHAAYLAGADLVRAVEIACQLDPGSAPPVEVAQL